MLHFGNLELHKDLLVHKSHNKADMFDKTKIKTINTGTATAQLLFKWGL
jgi:hypothetical protein